MAKSGRASAARPDLAREQGCSKRALAEAMDGESQRPSARAVGQAGEPKEPDVSRAISGVAARLVTLLWPRKEKLLAQARRAGENPSRPAACVLTAKPCHHTTAPSANTMPWNGRLRLTAHRPYDGNEYRIKTLPSPSPLQGREPKRPPASVWPNTAQPCRMPPAKGGVAAIGPGRVPSPEHRLQPACRTAAATSTGRRRGWRTAPAPLIPSA